MSSVRLACLLSLVVNTAVFAGTIDAPKASKKKEKKPVTEWSGATGGGHDASAQLVFNDEQWAALWKRLGKPAPAADMQKQIAAVVFLGQRPTGGFGVKWLDSVETKEAVVLKWSEKKPGEGDMVIQMITDPWAVKLYPKTPKAVKLEGARP